MISEKSATKVIVTGVLSFLVIPLSTFAAGGEPAQLVPKCKGAGGMCGYSDLVTLGQNFLTWAVYLVALASVVSLAWAGWLYLSSGGDSGKISSAHKIIWKVVVGIVVTLAAWLIVKSILTWMGVTDEWTLLS